MNSPVDTLKALAERAIPFLRDEADKYEDDGSNEPLELARDIESAIAALTGWETGDPLSAWDRWAASKEGGFALMHTEARPYRTHFNAGYIAGFNERLRLSTLPVASLNEPVSNTYKLPVGMKLVPVRPTNEMLDAGMNMRCSFEDSGGYCSVGKIYRAMLSAIPGDGSAQDSRSRLRRIAAERGEDAPRFDGGAAGHVSKVELLEWAVGRWRNEVSNRPLVNKHRRSLDDAWRQVIRRCGGDDVVICGPRHDELLAATPPASTTENP